MENSHKSFNLKKKVKKLLVDWLNRTSSHGLPNAVRAKTQFTRIVWLTFFFICLVLCCIAINQAFVDYYKYDTIITTKLIRESPTDYPAVTFCNLNPFNEQRAMSFMEKSLKGPGMVKCTDKNANLSEQRLCLTASMMTNSYQMRVLKRRLLNANLTNEERINYGFTIDDMLIDCEFNNKPCFKKDFQCYWNNDYGNCCTFNGGKGVQILRTNKAGSEYGLKLELAVRE
jgi:hypothetical protein